MPPWPRQLPRRAVVVPSLRRHLATRSAGHERVDIPTGSSGHVMVDLFNLDDHPSTAGLVIHLPPLPTTGSPDDFAAAPDDVPPLPPLLRNLPVARINYRWARAHRGPASLSTLPSPLAQWPSPVHDTAFAYAWLAEQLTPPGVARRPVCVHGTLLGAGLAASLALTESRPHDRFGVRGLVAHNGVYNWTMFLPGHPVHTKRRGIDDPPLAEGRRMEQLAASLPDLFPRPDHLFDPFASPSLFFHSPGLHVPRDFDDDPTQPRQSAMSAMVSRMTGVDDLADAEDEDEALLLEDTKPPRKSHLVFPPRSSTLKIPDTLLLHDRHVVAAGKTKGRRAASRKRQGNTLATQAEELAELMRRSVEKVEVKERRKWDDDMDGAWDDEAERRVRVVELGDEGEGVELAGQGHELALTWLEDRLV